MCRRRLHHCPTDGKGATSRSETSATIPEGTPRVGSHPSLRIDVLERPDLDFHPIAPDIAVILRKIGHVTFLCPEHDRQLQQLNAGFDSHRAVSERVLI